MYKLVGRARFVCFAHIIRLMSPSPCQRHPYQKKSPIVRMRRTSRHRSHFGPERIGKVDLLNKHRTPHTTCARQIVRVGVCVRVLICNWMQLQNTCEPNRCSCECKCENVSFCVCAVCVRVIRSHNTNTPRKNIELTTT